MRSVPAATGSGLSEIATPTSARTWTTVACVDESLAAFGSKVDEETAAVLEIPVVLEESTVTTRVTVWLPPFAMSPSEQVRTPAATAQLPTEGVAETRVVPAGSVSVTKTLDAVDGPVFATV